MNDDIKPSFLNTAIRLRNKMKAVCEADPVGDVIVDAQSCRTNRDRLESLTRWVERLEAKA